MQSNLGTCSNPKLSKQIISILATYREIEYVPASAYSSGFIIDDHP